MKLLIFFSLLVGVVSAGLIFNKYSIEYNDEDILRELNGDGRRWTVTEWNEQPGTENPIGRRIVFVIRYYSIRSMNLTADSVCDVWISSTANKHDLEVAINATDPYDEDPDTPTENHIVEKTRYKHCNTAPGGAGVCVKSGKCNNGSAPIVKQKTSYTPYRSMQTCPGGYDCCVEADVNEEYTAEDDSEKVLEGCGVRNRDGTYFRTLGKNRRASNEEFPWTVAIYRRRNKRWRYVCSGSLIHHRVVLTVAHYFDRFDIDDPEEAILVRAGDWNLKKKIELTPAQDSEVDSVAIHEEYDDGAKSYDVSLLFLRTAIKPASNIGFACLPDATRQTPVGTKCIMSGWGMYRLGSRFQDYMKMVEVAIVAHRSCESQLRELAENPDYELSKSILCAGGLQGQDACKGDGGAPLVCAYKAGSSRYYQAGIVSWGMGCGEANSPAAYVDVAVVRDWIDDVLVQNGINSDTYTPPKAYYSATLV